MVVLPEHPAWGRRASPSRSAPTSCGATGGAGRRLVGSRSAGGAAAGRRAARRRRATTAGQVGEHLAVDAGSRIRRRPRAGDRADHRGPDLPPLADGQHGVEVVGLDDGEHPLLALRRHDLEGLHARLAPRDRADVDVHADAARDGRLARRAAEAGAAEVLDPDHQAGVEQLEAGLDQPLLLERVADLHARPLAASSASSPKPADARTLTRRCRRARWTTRAARRGCPRRGPGQHEALGGAAARGRAR